MASLKDVELVPLKESKYVVPRRIQFVENETQKFWDVIEVHPSVTIIIYNVSRHVLVCVRQFRPAVYLSKIPAAERNPIDTVKYPREIGLALEWCSGIVDKEKSLGEIACDEIMEECGYRVNPKDLERVQSFRCSVGIAGDEMTLYYAEVTDEMRVSQGGGLKEEGEFIEIVELSISEAFDLLKSPTVTSPSDFLFGLLWFKTNKHVKLQTSV